MKLCKAKKKSEEVQIRNENKKAALLMSAADPHNKF
jgi:hypothetical protein